MSNRQVEYSASGLALRRLAVLFLVVLGSCSSKSTWNGFWTGSVLEEGYEPYSVEMSITAVKVGAPAGTVAYPGLNCSGTLLTEGIDGTSITFRESILENLNGYCVDAVKIVLTVSEPQSTTVAATYYMPDGYPIATAELWRTDAP